MADSLTKMAKMDELIAFMQLAGIDYHKGPTYVAIHSTGAMVHCFESHPVRRLKREIRAYLRAKRAEVSDGGS